MADARETSFPSGAPQQILSILLFLALSLVAEAKAQEIPVRQETLGQWHYLYPLSRQVYAGSQVPPLAVTFGPSQSRTAVLMPGSFLVAEFKNGHFFDLRFPTDLTPCTLASDPQKGTLLCLAQKGDGVYQNGFLQRWIRMLDSHGWTRPLKVPFISCDRLEFDAQDRLWALGPSPTIAVYEGGWWNTFSYSDDKNLGFVPIRLALNSAGDPVLFSYWRADRDREHSRLLGTLTYRVGKFIHDPQADTSAYIQAEVAKETESLTDPAGPSAGYVAQVVFSWGHHRTKLTAGGFTLVAIADGGLAWTSRSDNPTAAPLSVDREWSAVDHVRCPPSLDSTHQNLWILRNQPARLVRIGAQKSDEFPILPVPKNFGAVDTISIDVFGNSWLRGGLGPAPIVVLDGSIVKNYPDLSTALIDQSPKFQPGRILPFAIKTPSGLIAFGGVEFGEISVIDGGKTTSYQAAEIDPDEPNVPRPAHGYASFRGSALWMDHLGLLHITLLNRGFVYQNGRWLPSSADQEKESVIPPVPDDAGPDLDPCECPIEPYATSNIFFRGFHFYRKEGSGERQLDFGLNPLAHYPFTDGPYPAVVDPRGKIWIGPGDYWNSRDAVYRVGPINNP